MKFPFKKFPFKKTTALSVAALLSALSIGTGAVPPAQAAPKTAKNVIMLIPDGMSTSATTLARYMLPDNSNGDQNLTLDEYASALVTTTWDGGPITDSAPAGTAYATGRKSLNGALGIDAQKSPRASILEAAQMQGKAVGLVATSEFMHATPAAFSAHEEKRGNYATIAEQMLNQNIDVLLGSGAAKVPAETLDILATAKAKGYTIVKTKDDMDESPSTKVWGNFNNANGNDNNLSYHLDRIQSEEPSLAEMTTKAIEVLSRDKDGFFLMVEGSKIDWAAHANDTVGVISDTLAFDEAFKAAVEFAKQDGQTIVVAVTDHGNSGISIGNYDLTGYDSAPFSILEPLKDATKTAEGAMALLNKDKTNTAEVLQAYGINPTGYSPADATSKDRATKNNATVNALIDAFKSSPSTANLVKIMNQRAFIGYTTGGHTGEDVPLYVFAPEGITTPEGMIENTDVAQYVAQAMGLDLERTTAQLFVDVTEHAGASITGDTQNGYTLTLIENDKTLVIKANQSVATINGVPRDLNGEVALYINGRFYLPQSALESLQMNITKIGTYTATGAPNPNGGVTEIVKYNPENQKFYVVNGATRKLDVASLAALQANATAPTVLTAEQSIDIGSLLPPDFAYGDLTSVDVNTKHDLIAVAIQEADPLKNGKVALLDYNGNVVKFVDAGVQPDMVTFTPDDNYLLVANEGEPRNGYTAEDPKGSVTIIDVRAGIEKATGTNVYFDAFDSTRDDLIANKVILKKDAKPSVDLEPEYIAVAGDSQTAYVTLQEANAIATLDLKNKQFLSVKGLGVKDHSQIGNELDLINDGAINISTQDKLYGLYMPDGISAVELGGKTYLVTANEGDSREWSEFDNSTKVKIGGVKVTVLDPAKHDGLDPAKNYLFGGRSFSVWDAETMNQVFDSGSAFEKIVAQRYPDYFNCSNNNTTKDDRSGKKGPEPEDVKVGQVGDKTFAFIGLERIGGVMVYDITDLSNVKYVDYINTRDFSKDIGGDVSPEGLCFIPAANSPTDYPVLLAAHEVSGTVAAYQFISPDAKAKPESPGGSSRARTTEASGNGVTTIAANVNSNGNAVAQVSSEQISKLVSGLQSSEGEKIAQINIALPTAADSISLALPKDIFSKLTDGSVNHVAINFGLGTLDFDRTALEAMAATGSDITINLAKADTGALSKPAQALVGVRPVLEITVHSSTGNLANFGKGTLTARIPYTPATGEDQNAIVVCYLGPSGNPQIVPMAHYDQESGNATFVTNHLSLYAVGYNKVNFNDTTGHWANDDIAFLAARQVLTGLEDGQFSPDSGVTRAQFAAMLARLAAVDVANYKKTPFADVQVDDWFMPYVTWAVQNGIAQGVGDNKFEPHALITREQLSVMIHKFAQFAKQGLPATAPAKTFSDGSKISPWATEAVTALQEAEIIAGKPGNVFEPQSGASRAEAAKMLKQLVLIVNDKSM